MKTVQMAWLVAGVCALVTGVCVESARAQLPAADPARVRESDRIKLEPIWVKGQTAKVETSILRESIVRKKTTASQTLLLSADVRVETVLDRAAVISWTTPTPELEGLDRAAQAKFEEILAKDPLPAMLIVVTEDGNVSLQNLDVLRERCIAAIRELREVRAKADPAPPPTEAQSLAVMEGIFRDAQTGQGMLLRRVSGFFAGLGWSVAPGEKRGFLNDLPSPFGGAPLVANVVITIDPEPQASPSIVRLQWQQSLVKESKDRVSEHVKKLSGAPAETPLSAFDADIIDGFDYLFDRATGWFKEGVHVRTFKFGSSEQVETIVWTVQGPTAGESAR